MIGWTPLPLIFVHIPKCAGTSIEKSFIPLLTPHQDFKELNEATRSKFWLPGRQMLQHSKLRRYARQFPLGDYFKFTIVRNPWDRAVSQIEYLRSAGAPRFADGTFKDWLRDYCETTDNVRGHDLGASQTDYLTDETGKLAMDFVGRFENLAADFTTVCSQLGLNPAPALPHVFKSKREAHYSAYYDDEAVEMIRRRFARDIREFNYEFERKERPLAIAPKTISLPTKPGPRKKSHDGLAKLRGSARVARVQKAALGILFLHHDVNEVVLNNLASLRRHNPRALVVTMSAGEPLPGGYSLEGTPDLKPLHAADRRMGADWLVCSWFAQRKEQCTRWWIVEWDVHCTMPAREYYRPVWDQPFVASGVRLPRREPEWWFFRRRYPVPDTYREYRMGAVPFLYLFQEKALAATCEAQLAEPRAFGNCEMRIATIANSQGFPPYAYSPPGDEIGWVAMKVLPKKRGIFHPVKFIPDADGRPVSHAPGQEARMTRLAGEGPPHALGMRPRIGPRARWIGWCHHFFDAWQRWGRSPKCVIDVGANHGEWTRRALGHFPDAHYLMVEPLDRLMPHSADLLSRPNVRWVGTGVADKTGTLRLTMYPDDTKNTLCLTPAEAKRVKLSQIKVPVTTLDELAKTLPMPPDMVKIDAEGCDLRALQGATSLLGVTEVFLVECCFSCAYENTLGAVATFMEKHGYRAFDITELVRSPKHDLLWVCEVAFVINSSSAWKMAEDYD